MNDPRLKRPTTQDLIDQRHQEWIRSLHNRRSIADSKIIKLQDYTNGKTATGLSDRELEVLQLVSFGWASKDIADKLYLSTHTITNHRKNMLSRSRCGNIAELVRVALNENLL